MKVLESVLYVGEPIVSLVSCWIHSHCQFYAFFSETKTEHLDLPSFPYELGDWEMEKFYCYFFGGQSQNRNFSEQKDLPSVSAFERYLAWELGFAEEYFLINLWLKGRQALVCKNYSKVILIAGDLWASNVRLLPMFDVLSKLNQERRLHSYQVGVNTAHTVVLAAFFFGGGTFIVEQRKFPYFKIHLSVQWEVPT